MQQLELWDPLDIERGWSIRQSARARRLSVRVFRHGGVEVVVPLRTSPHRVSAFIGQQREWIERQRRRAIAPLPWPLPPDVLELSAFGERWRCVQRPSAAGVRVQVSALGAKELTLSGDLAHREGLRQGLIAWLVQHARQRFAAPLAALAGSMGVEPRHLQVRCQRTRWGSCSRRGTVSLNACLLFQRPEVVRYLLIHELSHLRHMNHSQHFWAEVARHEPDWKPLDRELLHGWKRVPSWVFSRH